MMKFGSKDLAKDVLIVAEVGNNHEGDFERAKLLVRKAAEAHVDAVKFQTFKTEKFVSPKDPARFNRLKSFELSYAQFKELSQLAHQSGLLFVSSPLDLESADFLEPWVDYYKIASGDNDFYPLIARVARTGKPVIVSTGLSDWPQVQRTTRFIQKEWKRRKHKGHLAVLHCVTSYPTPPEQANLNSIAFLQEKLDCPVGYSDHTMGADACLAAVALGARIIEKHFTIDKHLSDFRDHALSADPAELSDLTQRIRRLQSSLGTYGKRVQACEEDMVPLVRRSIAAGSSLEKGHILTVEDLIWIRPRGGLPPGAEKRLLGKKLKRAVAASEFITPQDVGSR